MWAWEALGLPDPPEVEHTESVPEFGPVGWALAAFAVASWTAVGWGARRVARLVDWPHRAPCDRHRPGS